MPNAAVMLIVFVVAFGIGHVLISRVPQMLHTPLMSMTNAISAITILGALLLFTQRVNTAETVLGITAIAAATFNFVGGFVITDRMLGFFRTKEAAPGARHNPGTTAREPRSPSGPDPEH